MVRNYKHKRTVKYSQGDLQNAIRAVKEGGMKVTAASKKFDVPRSTLFDHVRNSQIKFGAGHPTILTHSEEKEIVLILQVYKRLALV